MTDFMIHYQRKLPHLQPPDRVFSIVFRLAGSLPEHIAAQLKAERAYHFALAVKQSLVGQNTLERRQAEQRYFGMLDAHLDAGQHGPLWLKIPALATIVKNKILEFDRTRYVLIAFSIMPNHTHLLIDTRGFSDHEASGHHGKTGTYPLADTLRLLKGNTSRFCNKGLNRNGTFWHHESYDHCVRDDEELSRIAEYIIYNPVKAGLVKEWHQWAFSYLNTAYFEAKSQTSITDENSPTA